MYPEKISIITATLNNEDVIKDCLSSVYGQTYSNLEHIVIDGKSTDRTLDIIQDHPSHPKVLSEKDEGLYYALNRGLLAATGDVIAFLHADDTFNSNDTVSRVMDTMKRTTASIVYGDLVYTPRSNINKILRYWKSGQYRPGLLKFGWMPPHPTLFLRSSVYRDYGQFNTNYHISSDYEFIHRVFSDNEIKSVYLPEVLVRMRAGGTSNRSISNILRKLSEDWQVTHQYRFQDRLITIVLKNISKLPQFFQKPPRNP